MEPDLSKRWGVVLAIKGVSQHQHHLNIIKLFGSLNSCAGVHDFASGACERVEPYLFSELVGQDLAVQQACDAICDHLAKREPQKPLVLSAHGPPGVGKTMMHLLLARALYSKKPSDELRCPGTQCLGYKVPHHSHAALQCSL